MGQLKSNPELIIQLPLKARRVQIENAMWTDGVRGYGPDCESCAAESRMRRDTSLWTSPSAPKSAGMSTRKNEYWKGGERNATTSPGKAVRDWSNVLNVQQS